MRFSLTLFIFLFSLSVIAQQTKSDYIKFGQITAEELQKKVYAIDSNADAVVLSDIGEAAIVGNSKGWFSISFKRHRVVHILNKNGYDKANVEIPLYTNGEDEEKLSNIKAVTYNFENGKINSSKLEKSGIFKDKINKNLILQKFTFPDVKEGCIVEYSYEVTSDFIENLDPWYFQENCPVLWSEYTLSVPQFFSYAFMGHGYNSMYINDKKDRQDNFSVADSRSAGPTDRVSFSSGVTDYRWVMKDVPELKPESFTSSIKNHISRIEFQLSSQNYPLTPHDFRNSWPMLTKELLESEGFGKALSKDNNWLSDDVKPLIAKSSSDLEKAQKIFAFVRDNFSCTDHSQLWAEHSLKDVDRSRKGSVAEINLLLTAMLRYANLFADPVILSTTDNGYALEMYPMISSFNYVVCQASIGDKKYYLDASRQNLGFGILMPECYNGHARVIDEQATGIVLSADSLKERKVTALFIANSDKGGWGGTMNQTSGYYESYNIRRKIKDKGQEEFFKQIQKDFGSDVKIKNPHVDSLTNYDVPVTLHYEVDLDPGKEDILYINPMFGEGYKDNPFKAAQRFYPVEMPYTMDETYILTLEIPNGYVVDELPKPIRVKFDEKESAYFEYLISQSGNTISLRSRIKTTRTLFLPDEYETFREFFKMIVSKQNEQIVFKKKK